MVPFWRNHFWRFTYMKWAGRETLISSPELMHSFVSCMQAFTHSFLRSLIHQQSLVKLFRMNDTASQDSHSSEETDKRTEDPNMM